MKSGELDGEWRVKSGEWREVWGNICGCRGTERTGNVLRAGWPARVPCNPAPTVEFVSIAIRKVPGSKDVPAGGACPAPTNGGIFAAVAGQGQPRNVPAGRIYPAPTDGGIFAAVAGQSGQAVCLRATD